MGNRAAWYIQAKSGAQQGRLLILGGLAQGPAGMGQEGHSPQHLLPRVLSLGEAGRHSALLGLRDSPSSLLCHQPLGGTRSPRKLGKGEARGQGHPQRPHPMGM